ncbi:MAG TPA: hypothetical protein VFJ05_06975 [Nitrososphaeraceae archaeon]|nr:hypothetical protein [Nitrososphaeraceae archaeon]
MMAATTAATTTPTMLSGENRLVAASFITKNENENDGNGEGDSDGRRIILHRRSSNMTTVRSCDGTYDNLHIVEQCLEQLIYEYLSSKRHVLVETVRLIQTTDEKILPYNVVTKYDSSGNVVVITGRL